MKARIRDLNEAHDTLEARLQRLDTRLQQLEVRGPSALAQSPESSPKAPLLPGSKVSTRRIEQAAWELENTSLNMVLPKYPTKITEARQHHFQLLRANRWYYRAIVGLILLTCFEVPAWCHGDGGAGAAWTWEPGPSRCTLPGKPMLSGAPYLPPGWAFVAEFLIELLILRKFLLEYTLERDHFMPLEVEYHTQRVTQLGVFFAVGSILDTAVFLIWRVPFRFTFIFRTGLIFLMPNVRHLFFNIFNRTVMAEFSSVAMFFIGTMIFFAFIGVTLFQYDETVVYHEGEEVVRTNKGLKSFGPAVYSMFLGGVTGEFLTVFLPSFLTYKAAGILWAIYLLLTKVLLKNLVMDTLISQYIKGVENEAEATMKVQANGMLTAFDLLTYDTTLDGGAAEVSPSEFSAFVACLRSSPRWKSMPPRMAELLHEQVGRITRENFCDVCMLLQNEFWVTEQYSHLRLQDKPEYSWLCRWVREPEELPAFDKFMNKILLLNLAMVFLETTYDLMDWDEPPWMDYVEIVFAFLYLGEVYIKLAVKSFGEYWSFPANRFDFFTTWLLLTTSLLPYMPIETGDTDFAQYANILRLLRLIRVLKQLKQFPSVQFMVGTISRIVTAAGDILSLMGTFFFFFCTLSVNLFGGVLYAGNPKLEGTEYAESYWYQLNFNDMFNAFLTWFAQILCEYVPAYAQALHHASEYGNLAWWVVVLFYVSTAAIMYELLLAFTIDVYLEVKNDTYKEEEEEEEKEEEEKEEGEGHGHHHEEASHGHEEDCGHESPAESEEAKSPKTPHAFFTGLQDLLADVGTDIHYSSHYDSVRQKEFKEAYEEACHKGLCKDDQQYSDKEAICKAAWELEDGVRGFKVPRYPKDLVTARNDYLKVLQATAMYNKAIICLIALTLTEVPAWCHSSAGGAGFWEWQPGTVWCAADGGGDLHLSGLWYLPPGLALILELGIEIVILRKFLLESRLEHEHFREIGVEYMSRSCILWGCIFSVGSIIDTAAFAGLRCPFRLTFLFRTGILCLLPGVRRLSARIFNRKMMGEFTFVALFFIMAVVLFAWITFTIFKDLDDVAYYKAGEPIHVNAGFASFRDTTYTMFNAAITEGFVDIMLPTTTTQPAFAILWVIFLVLTQVLLLNLVIDTFVAAYLEGSEHTGEENAELRAKAALSAFTVLAKRDGTARSRGSLSKDTLLAFVAELSRSPRKKPIEPNTAEVILEHFGSVTKESFCDLCPILQNTVWVTQRNSIVEVRYPELWNSPRFKKLRRAVWEPKETPLVDDVMNWVLFFNLLLIAAQFGVGKVQPLWMKLADLAFTLVYVGEVLLKLSVKSFEEYWSYPANQFDFFTTCLLFGTTVLKHLPILALQRDLSHYANILRLLRLVRVVKKLKQYPSFQFMVSTIYRMVEAAGDILSLLGVVLFFFATFSVNCFGGLLYEGNPKLVGSDMAKKHWFVFNFNDTVMASATWFVQLLAEYSPELADGLWKTSAYGEVAWWIFPAFYLVGVAILFEILEAFTIETFLALKEQTESERKAEEGDEESSSEDEAGGSEANGAGQEVELLQASVLEGIQRRLEASCEKLHCRPGARDAFRRKLKAEYLKLGEPGGS